MTCLAMMSACRDFESDRLVEQSVGDCYINIAIAVSGGTTHNRADDKPQGGENGDGREAGFERENTVTGITLILYQDAAGINTTDDPILDFVRYYPVTFGSRDPQGTSYSSKKEEARYTTGPQPLGRHRLNLKGSYHAIVIANAPEAAATLKEGISHLSDVRSRALSKVYDGLPTQLPDKITNFAMTSEQDNIINFGAVTATDVDGGSLEKGEDMLFNLEGQTLIIERMTARLDFSTKYSTTDKVEFKNTYDRPGYVYRVWNALDITAPDASIDATRDHFVVVSVTPFNVSNGDTWLFKRLADDTYAPNSASNKTSSYAKRGETYVPRLLDDESITSWVLDKYSGTAKTSTAYPLFMESELDAYKTQASLASNPYNRELTTEWHSVTSNYFTDSDGSEAFIVNYPKENTVDSDTPLYYYATGLAIEGIYYKKGTTTGGTPKVYYGFLRHQGESLTSYDAFKLEGKDATETATLISNAKAMKCAPGTAMNFGVVRNNIYRISINKITEQGELELKIKVKKWDPYIHEYIYM